MFQVTMNSIFNDSLGRFIIFRLCWIRNKKLVIYYGHLITKVTINKRFRSKSDSDKL